jgi:hypothetical protein
MYPRIQQAVGLSAPPLIRPVEPERVAPPASAQAASGFREQAAKPPCERCAQDADAFCDALRRHGRQVAHVVALENGTEMSYRVTRP